MTVCGLGFGLLQVDGDHQHQIVLRTEFDKDVPSLSPDGRLLEWDSSESGRWEVYAASFPEMTQQVQVSNAGGGQPKLTA